MVEEDLKIVVPMAVCRCVDVLDDVIVLCCVVTVDDGDTLVKGIVVGICGRAVDDIVVGMNSVVVVVLTAVVVVVVVVGKYSEMNQCFR